MSNQFKTPVLEKWLDALLQQYPILKANEEELKKILQDIDLPEKSQSYETYKHELDFIGCGTVQVSWNIDKILNYTPKEKDIMIMTTEEILYFFDLKDHNIKEIMKSLKPKGEKKHRGKYIVLAMFPGFPKYIVIDGNHRVLENISNPKQEFECITIPIEKVVDFLEPNSRKLCEFILYMSSLVRG